MHTHKYIHMRLLTLSLSLSLSPSLPPSLPLSSSPSPPSPILHTHTGCDQRQCFSDTWALNLDTGEWILLINTSAVTFPYPEARFTTAGGIYPGQNELWLSMGETSNGRRLSDTWILRLNLTMDGSNVIYEGKRQLADLYNYNVVTM